MVKAILPAESLHSPSEEARLATIEGASPVSGASVDFPTIYRQNHAAIWRFLRHLGVRESDVPDVTHNVFLIAYRKLPGFEHRSSDPHLAVRNRAPGGARLPEVRGRPSRGFCRPT